MAFEYGSDSLGIRNPFRIEGAIRVLVGAAQAIAGSYLIFSVRSYVEMGEKAAGWLTLVIALLLLASGIVRLGGGLSQILRFFVGRSVPTSLSQNVSKSEAHVKESGVVYNHQLLEQMLQGRKNPTFAEPQDAMTRIIYTILPRLLFLPFPYRNLAQRFIGATLRTLVAFFCLGLAWFSGSTGLTNINDTPVMDWMTLLLLVYLLWIWWAQRKPFKRALEAGGQAQKAKGDAEGTQYVLKPEKKGDSLSRMILVIVATILLPVILAMFHGQVSPLPELAFNTAVFNTLLTVLAVMVCALVGAMAFFRSLASRPLTEVAEFRENWQESIHPQEIFINFENIVMANRRYKEVPNRIYRDWDANLMEQGSDDKGKFNGEMIQETQPVYHEPVTNPVFKLLRVIATLTGQALILIASLFLFTTIDTLLPVFSSGGRPEVTTIMPAIESLLTVTILWLFGRILANAAHVFWAEIQFDSMMVYFQCTGTYTESRLTTGKGVYDSTESQNLVIRSSMTFWVLASKLMTSTFAGTGTRNLEFPRYVLELHKAGDELNTIIDELRGFAQQREAIASINNELDLAAADRIFQVNQQTRSASPSSDTPVIEASQYKIGQHEQDQDDEHSDKPE